MDLRSCEGRENDETVSPLLSTAFGNRCGDYHISTATTTTGMDEYPSKPAR